MNFPDDLTLAHSCDDLQDGFDWVDGDSLDDIHPSYLLVYLNALTHYSVMYQDTPYNLLVTNAVPENLANIVKEVTWDVVSNDPRTGLMSVPEPNATVLVAMVSALVAMVSAITIAARRKRRQPLRIDRQYLNVVLDR
ncbi:MAG: hypothetical protein R3C03_09150 [Pirellulaceae bacterium]